MVFMIKEKIFLKTLDDVKNFVTLCMSKPYDIELVLGKYVVNAKSIMGVFSLDLTQPLTMIINSDSDSEITNQIAPFIFVEPEQ